jgi:dihydroflavonol-4-reductase
MQKIFITGVSGFIGLHMALEGLKKGYEVVGTVRSQEKEDEVINTLKKYVSSEMLEKLTIQQCDLLKPEKWQEAMKGCDAILHVASPFLRELPKDEMDIINPARFGVKHVFEAALANGITRIIQTSSSVAMMYGHEAGRVNFDETDWTNLKGPMISPYIKSKTLAEMDVWQYVKDNPTLKVTCVNPGFVLGPVLGSDVGTSPYIVQKMMNGDYPGVPKLGFPTVDVRDVVAIHFAALTSEKAIGQRYAATSSSIWFKDIAAIILKAYPGYKKYVKARELPNWFIKIYAIFENSTRMIVPELGFCAHFSTKKIEEDLGIHPISAEDAVIACAQSLIDLKLLKHYPKN